MKTSYFSLRAAALLVLSLAILPLTGFADDEGPPEIQVRALMLGGGSARHIHLPGEDGMVAVRVSNVQPSPPVKSLGFQPYPIFEEIPEEWTPEDPPQPAASILLPPNTAHVLLLVSHGGERANYAAIPDDLQNATNRDWRLINTTENAIAFQIGADTEPVILRPRSQVSHRLTTGDNRGTAVTAVARIEGTPSTFFSTYWPIQTNRRGLVVFSQDGEDILVHRISEALIPEEDQDE